ncbi:hypothetical protein [Rhodococcus sovatensis]|uniref:Uncharacterized protein n=1 Tax=Rhodococcus sovatensis TaxID=1805840 RepID=A0ABZ2PSG2_9NOCA
MSVFTGESETANTPPAPEIVAEGSDLFALLIDEGLVSDDAETFTHLRAGGWAALRPAIVASAGVGSFLSATLLDGMVDNALADGATSVEVAQKDLANLTEYVPEDDWASLQASTSTPTGTDYGRASPHRTSEMEYPYLPLRWRSTRTVSIGVRFALAWSTRVAVRKESLDRVPRLRSGGFVELSRRGDRCSQRGFRHQSWPGMSGCVILWP